MSLSDRLGRAFRREASLTSVRNVRHLDSLRVERSGASAQELNDRFAVRVSQIEARVAALESEVLNTENLG